MAKNKTQKVYLQQESGSEFQYFTIFLRNKVLIYKATKPFYNWQIYYSSRYYDVLPEFNYKTSFLDTLEIKYDSANYDRMMIVTNRDSVFAGSIALEFQDNPILLFSSDLNMIKLNKINLDFLYEISLVILFLTSILASLYHIFKIKTRGLKTLYKFLFFIILISWSGVNIYQISKPILEFYINLA